MRVLLIESDSRAGDPAVLHLEAAGHDVVLCPDRGEPVFPCRGLFGCCPLDEAPVDVALLVRAHPWPRPTPREFGVTCALRRHVPLVVAGMLALNPYERYATTLRDGDGDVVATCDWAAEAPLPSHGDLASEALADVLGRAGIDTAGSTATVTRREGRLRVSVHAAQPLDHAIAHRAAVRVIGALRRLDRDATGVDVDVEAFGGGPPTRVSTR